MIKNECVLYTSLNAQIRHALSNSFNSVYVYDMKKLAILYNKWCTLFPNITPHYAVKCNPNPMIIKCLGNLGISFDCASAAEITTVLKEGISSDKILYANPCKNPSDIVYAIENDVTVTTFDSVCEIEKIASIRTNYPSKKHSLILRIHAIDPTAKCVLSNKYGAIEEEWDYLLESVKKHKQTLIGISFHIGSGACNPEAYNAAIQQARRLYDKATYDYNFRIKVLDIGGGFTESNIRNMADAINDSLEEYFPSYLGVRFISEPGRYFAETCADLYTKIIGVRERGANISYTITDSLYGSFNNVIYDHASLNPIPVFACTHTAIINPPRIRNTLVYGCTCDGIDEICDVKLPKLQYGDWLLWENMGAYTIAGACDFNGIVLTTPTEVYIYDSDTAGRITGPNSRSLSIEY